MQGVRNEPLDGRTEVIQVRVTPEEKQAIKEAARARRLTVGEFLRDLAARAAKRKPPV
jgi:uncharacterized protein (DUF1778 family)